MYMIKSLAVKDGKPVVPGADHVSEQDNNFFIAYGRPVNRRYTLHAVIYRDASGNFLVGADQEVLDTMPGGETLQALVSRDPTGWRSWKCDTATDSNKLITTDKMAIDVNKTKPLAIDAETNIVGAIPTVPGSIANFVVEEVEKDCQWIGDKAEKVEIIDELRL